MSEEQKTESRPVESPAEAPRLVSPEFAELAGLMKQYGKPTLLWIGAALAGVALGVGYKFHRQTGRERASDRLWNAKSVQDLELAAEDSPSSLAAVALIKVAKRYYDTQQYDLAMKKYGEIQTRFPSHPLVDIAEMGKLHCLEARGQLHEALDGFVAFAKAHPGHYLAPQALLAEARCLSELGRMPEARARCEEFIVAYAKDPWEERGEDLLKTLTRLSARQAASVTIPIQPSSESPELEAAPLPPAATSNIEIKLDLGFQPAEPAPTP
ncbi:MAG: tetratricopeptide repeat protein [Verrucomicrobiota bacterium]|nr:tetratricopeptide repeat protein [Verrucomicrobiota bacterium]